MHESTQKSVFAERPQKTVDRSIAPRFWKWEDVASAHRMDPCGQYNHYASVTIDL
ncbi:hypothetical protein BAUCODRAFT_37509 [Baudoinia panamericana UAMH 10762]|uniref:Uncharacterized protein n=1 Tax=Baudoinia panamericana (strain UAMH 10762) TaxID=717646 RepID=M2MMJ1_BAUPA|nr:uncharacterized protein BAUCODRAFT_37509 [Baudoinia panamericana UAMH 10762]EMC92618.1 hypothetical protein BAUCODRAFT_37509 [Baudoinia panamericana UAMH 10762]